MTDFGEFLLIQRRRANKTQTRLAQDVGVHANTIRNIEGGKHTPNLALASALCVALGARYVIGSKPDDDPTRKA